MRANDLKTSENLTARTVDFNRRKEETFNYFPFVSGDLIEEHRRGLNK